MERKTTNTTAADTSQIHIRDPWYHCTWLRPLLVRVGRPVAILGAVALLALFAHRAIVGAPVHPVDVAALYAANGISVETAQNNERAWDVRAWAFERHDGDPSWHMDDNARADGHALAGLAVGIVVLVWVARVVTRRAPRAPTRSTEVARVRDRDLSPAQRRRRYGIYIDGRPLPTWGELRHILCIGATGSGKSQIVRHAARTARSRMEPMIVLDWGGELTQRLYRDDRDALIGPHDARSVPWHPLSDIHTEADTPQMAAALIPQPKGSSQDDEWTGYARTWLDAVLLAASRREADGEPVSNYDLRVMINSGDIDPILEYLDPDHPAMPMLTSDDTMVRNVRNIAASKTAVLRALDPDATGGEWSIREHIDALIRGDHSDDLFISVPPDYSEDGIILGRVFSQFAIQRLLSHRENEDRRVWLLVDEMGQYPQLAGIERGATLGRKYGLAMVASVQATSQLAATYGRDTATTLMANFGSKLVFRANDAETAEWASKTIGDIERTYTTESTSTSHNKPEYDPFNPGGSMPSTSTTRSQQQHRDRVRSVMPRQIMQLPELYYYTRAVDQSEWFRYHYPVQHLGDPRHPPHVPRPSTRPGQRPAPVAPALEAPEPPGISAPTPTITAIIARVESGRYDGHARRETVDLDALAAFLDGEAEAG